MDKEPWNQRIDELEGKWYDGSISPEEVKEYMDWYNQERAQPVIIPGQSGMDEATHKENLFSAIQSRLYVEDTAEISAVKPSSTGVIHFLSRRFRRYAAAILVIAGAGVLWYLSADKKTDGLVVSNDHFSQQDALPGHNGAILTLADGKKIVLDSLGNGVLTTQGKTTVSAQNGQLVYDAGMQEGEVLYNTMTTPNGRQYQLRLPDGTLVWLNAASAITYPTAFTGGERKVMIRGEVYFEVAKSKEKPFIVAIDGGSSVEVLGTHFNINSYGDEESIRTTLLEGSVRVTHEQNRVTLAPGEQAVQSQQAITVVNNADMDAVMAWKQGVFRFNRTDLRTVMRQLSRWYDVEVVYEGNVKNEAFIGELPMHAPASQVLKALEEIGVHFNIEGKRIIVRP